VVLLGVTWGISVGLAVVAADLRGGEDRWRCRPRRLAGRAISSRQPTVARDPENGPIDNSQDRPTRGPRRGITSPARARHEDRMADAVMGGFLDRVRAAVGPADDARTDAQLLRAYADGRDGAAFAVLVGRYGPLVWAVCRRVVGDPHAAEDAFQATFLVLARKAGAVRPGRSAAGWLYRTATHIALKARARSARRGRPQRVPDVVAAEPPTAPDPAALAALHEEVARLPDGLRAAVVLCELQGASRRAAAAHLGVAEGTLSSRLAAARRKLANRLRRRGFPAAGGIGVFLAAAGPATAAPARVLAAAVTRGDGSGRPIPTAVTSLADTEIRFMLATRLSPLGAGLGVLAVAAGLWLAAAPAAPVAVPGRGSGTPREGVITVASFPRGVPIELWTPDGKAVVAPAVGGAAAPINPGEAPVCPLQRPRLSPSGRQVLAVKLGPIMAGGGPYTPNHLWLFDLDAKDGPGEAVMSDLRAPHVVWSRDGKTLYGSSVDPEKVMAPREKGKPIPMVSWAYDPARKTRTPLQVPDGHAIMDLSPDGKTVLTVVWDSMDFHPIRSYLVGLDTGKARPLTERPFNGTRFSPDGKSVLGNRAAEKGAVPPPLPLGVVSVADGSERALPVVDGAEFAAYACWSPDGRRIAYHWQEEVPPPPAGGRGPVAGAVGPPPKFHASRVTVADADGRNARTIIRREHDQPIMGLDWR
jgi:RNA polymerase sigma factor (sigma-70 family)